MRKEKFIPKKMYLGMIILIAASGSLLFFPMNIGGHYTCFYHRLFDPPQTESGFRASINIQDNSSNDNADQVSGNDHSALLDNYLHRYAFIWWGSIVVLTLALYLFRKYKRKVKMNESSVINELR
jgi:hypothetical protein